MLVTSWIHHLAVSLPINYPVVNQLRLKSTDSHFRTMLRLKTSTSLTHAWFYNGLLILNSLQIYSYQPLLNIFTDVVGSTTENFIKFSVFNAQTRGQLEQLFPVRPKLLCWFTHACSVVEYSKTKHADNCIVGVSNIVLFGLRRFMSAPCNLIFFSNSVFNTLNSLTLQILVFRFQKKFNIKDVYCCPRHFVSYLQESNVFHCTSLNIAEDWVQPAPAQPVSCKSVFIINNLREVLRWYYLARYKT